MKSKHGEMSKLTRVDEAAARGRKLAKPITPEQLKYLEVLFIDLGFSTKQRGAWLEDRTAGRTRFLDELFLSEATEFIDALKGQKNRQADRWAAPDDNQE